MARGHHHRPEHHPHPEHPVHERAHGGRTEKHPGSYTAEGSKEEEEEAEGKYVKHGGRARADGGAVALRHGGRAKHHIEHHHHYKKGGRLADGGAAAPALADGGAVALKRGGRAKHVDGEGHKTKHRNMSRPGRKSGGGIGATRMPLSTAAHAHQMGHTADADELAK